MSVQALSPPTQDSVLHFAGAGAGYTTSISLGSGFTMECWLSLDAPAPFAVVMGKPDDPRGADPFMNYVIGLDSSGTMLAFVQTTGQAGTYRQITAPSPILMHTWTHVAAVLDSGTMKLFVNGQLVASGASPGPPGGTAVPFAIGGAIPDGTVQSLCCGATVALRQARVWSRALSPAEVQSFAAKTLTGNEPGLLADWPLDDGSGSPRDLGPQHLALTLAGSASWMSTAVYDGGPYWDFKTFQTPNAGGGIGTVVDMGSHGITVLSVKAQALRSPNGVMAFRWTPSGFADVTSTVFPDPGPQTWMSRDWAVADFNGDGRPDVFLATTGLDQSPFAGAQSRIFIQSADGTLVDETATRLPAMNGFTHSVAAADIDGDGDVDLYLGNICCGAPPQLYINDGSGHFTARTAGLPDFVSDKKSQDFTSARFLDVNNDGSPDLVLGGDTANSPVNLVLLNDGHGNFTPSPHPMPPKMGGIDWSTVGIEPADYDGDGYTDLILAMTDFYQGPFGLQLLLNNGDGTFRDATSQIPQNWPIVPATNGQLNGSWIPYVVPFDINGDGWIDFVTPGFPSPHLFINQGQGRFVDETAFLPAGGTNTQVYVSDFDGDGRADIFYDFFAGQYGFARGLKTILPAQTRPGGGANTCSYQLNLSGEAFPPAGGSGTLAVATGPYCAWSVTGIPDWISLTGGSNGTGSGTVGYQVSANSAAARSIILAVAGLPFTVEQAPVSISGSSATNSLAQVVSGGSWNFTLEALNLGSTAAEASINFTDNLGHPLALPLTFPQSPPAAGPELASTLDRTLNPNAQIVMESTGPDNTATLIGSGQLLSNGNVSGFGIFSNPKLQWNAVVPLETRNAGKYILAFDNTAPLTTGVAVANLAAQAQNVPAIIRDDTGAQIGNPTIPLSALGHTSFMLNDPNLGFPVTNNKRGTIEFDTPPGGQISVLGLRANGPALTTLPVLANVGTTGGSITHVAYNRGWSSVFYLVNTGNSLAQFTLSFHDENGAALAVPLLLPQSGATITTAALTQTLAAGAMLVVNTQAQDALALVVGSAQLTTTGNISGFEIFRWETFGQEASVPLETRTPGSFVLAFDDTNGLTTGVALANQTASPANITVLIYGDSGTLLQSASINLGGSGHTSFMLPDNYAVTANKRGMVEFLVPQGSKISAIGLRAKNDGTLTTIPVLTK